MGVITFNDFKDKNPKKENLDNIDLDSLKKDEISKNDIGENLEDIVKKVDKIISPVKPEQTAQKPVEKQPELEPPVEKQPEQSGYKLYRDKQENFSCEISIEGASFESSKVRLVIESPEWNLFFNGTIEKNGKCTIPIKKLPILTEGTSGIIRLEVIADDTIFVPWEEEFIVKNSKKVIVKVMEQETFKPNVKIVMS